MIEKRRKKYDFTNEKIIAKFLYTNLILIIPIVALYFHVGHRDEIINDFRSNKILTCTLQNLIIDVSNQDSWKIDDSYFIKDKSKIPISKCEKKD